MTLLILSAIFVQAFPEQQSASEPESLFEMSLEELMQVEVYTTSGHTQTISEAPSSTTIVSAEEIREHGYRTVLDILHSIRGFYRTHDRKCGYACIRGVCRPGDYLSGKHNLECRYR